MENIDGNNFSQHIISKAMLKFGSINKLQYKKLCEYRVFLITQTAEQIFKELRFIFFNNDEYEGYYECHKDAFDNIENKYVSAKSELSSDVQNNSSVDASEEGLSKKKFLKS